MIFCFSGKVFTTFKFCKRNHWPEYASSKSQGKSSISDKGCVVVITEFIIQTDRGTGREPHCTQCSCRQLSFLQLFELSRNTLGRNVE